MTPRAALHHGFIGLFHIDSWNLSKDGIGEHRDGVVTNHAVVVLSPKVPDGQVTVGLVMQNHIPHKLRGDVGRDERVKRMRGAESVPKAESAVIRLSLRHLLDFEVGIHVAAIHVAHCVGLHQYVVKARVENGFLLVGALDVDTAQFALPNVVGGLHIVVKIPTLCLGEHVFACAFIING